MVVDARSQKIVSIGISEYLVISEWLVAMEIQYLSNRCVRFDISVLGGVLLMLRLSLHYWSIFKSGNLRIVDCMGLRLGFEGKARKVALNLWGILKFKGWICILRVGDLIRWYFRRPIIPDVPYTQGQLRCIEIWESIKIGEVWIGT